MRNAASPSQVMVNITREAPTQMFSPAVLALLKKELDDVPDE
jgi:hypothetical protein